MPERDVIVDGAALKLRANGREFSLHGANGALIEGSYSVVEIGPETWSVLLNGRSHFIRGDRDGITVIDPRAPRPRDASGGVEGRQSMRAAMPGKVIRVLVSPGDSVTTGQGLVVVEAMKMQNEVKSNKSGAVISVAVKDGATVNAGDLLVVVE